MPDLLDRDQILDYLREVAGILGDEGPKHVIVMVGGALLALHHLREATRDVDSVKRIDDELAKAAEQVAERHDLAPEWLNANASPYRPLTLDERDCGLVFEIGRLRVLEAPMRQVFLMKLRSDRSADHADLVPLWPHAGFESAEQAVAEYWEAYPEAPDDEYLVGYVRDIMDRAG